MPNRNEMMSQMQPALPAVKELLGKAGYRTYAGCLDRHPISFHIAISNASSRVSALVNLTCAMMRAARDAGYTTDQLLDEARTARFLSFDERSGLHYAIETTIGGDAVSVLSRAIPMARRDVTHALSSRQARNHPHFRLIATISLALKMRGISPRAVILDHLDDWPQAGAV